MLSMLHLDNPSLDWVKIAEGQGVPATRATTAEEFHKQFEAAMSTKGPHPYRGTNRPKPATDYRRSP